LRIAAGVKEIEVTSFVAASVFPQFSDADAVARETLTIPNLDASALVPNLRGAKRAFDSGLRNIGFVLSASEKHNMANVHRTTEQSLEEFANIVAERKARHHFSTRHGRALTAGAAFFRHGCVCGTTFGLPPARRG